MKHDAMTVRILGSCVWIACLGVGAPAALGPGVDGVEARPISVATGDLDGDGTVELVVGYVDGESTWLAVRHGIPEGDAASSRTPSFSEEETTIALSQAPEILVVADFDDDGRDEIAHAARDGEVVELLDDLVLDEAVAQDWSRRRLRLPGRVTLVVAGEINRRDGVPDLIAAVESDGQPLVVVYEGWGGIEGAVPEQIPLPAAPRRLVLGQLDDRPSLDLGIDTEDGAFLLVGRDRRLDSPSAEIRSSVEAPTVVPIEDPRAASWPRPAATFPASLAQDAEREPEASAGRSASQTRVPARGGGLLVNSELDSPDGAVGDGLCDTGNMASGLTGLCTLRAAIQEHNTGGFGRPIVVGPPGGTPIQPLSGLPSITMPVDLLAGGAVIDGSMCFSCPIGVRILNAGGSSVRGLIVQSFPVALQIDNGDANSILGNRFGTDAAGNSAVGGATSVLLLNSSDNQISDNIVAGAFTMTFAGSSTNTFRDNFLGVGPSGADLGSGGINGSSGGGNQSDIRRNVIANGGIEFASIGAGEGSVIVDNIVGSDASGATIVGVSDIGIGVNATDVTIRRNLVVGQSATGISAGGSGGVVERNLVGLDLPTGATPLANGYGIVTNGSDTRVLANTASGSQSRGIDALCTGGVCEIRDNLVGTDATGMQAVGNGTLGVAFGALGGRVEMSGNTVSGNLGGGVRAGNGEQHVVRDNRIGTDKTGSSPIPNVGTGLLVQSKSSTVRDNVVSGNLRQAGVAGHGIEINGVGATGNTVAGNHVGVAADGTTPMGNEGRGVFVNVAASGNTIGGTQAADANVVAYNGDGGVVVGSGTGNSIRGNSIFENAGLGIDLAADGPTANDLGDSDSGANNRQNSPTVLDLGGQKQITLSSSANGSFDIELFSDTDCDPSGFGEARTFLASATISTDASGVGAVSIANGARVVSATATNTATGDTSELSSCVARPASMVNSQRNAEDLLPGNGACDTGQQVTILGLQKAECTLRAAIQESNAAPGDDVILFDPDGPGEPGATPDGYYLIRPLSSLPDVTDTVRIGGAPGSQDADLDGAIAGTAISGLRFLGGAARSEVRDLAVYSFAGHGIEVLGADGFGLRGSSIGTNRASASGLGNGGVGVLLQSVTGATLGVLDHGNVISGNGGSGVRAESSSTLLLADNGIGTKAGGTASLGNGGYGVQLISTDDSTVGGNVVSGNSQIGIALASSDHNELLGNWIGVGSDGGAMPNEGGGVAIGEFSDGNRVSFNEISENDDSGLSVTGFRSQDNLISFNEISRNGSGVVLAQGAHDNEVVYNRIDDNSADGIAVRDADTVRNALDLNELAGNGDLAIDLEDDGVTANDPGDVDAGPNHRQNFPVVTRYDTVGVAGGSLQGPPFTSYSIDLYANETCDPSGNGEAERLVWVTGGTTDAMGTLSWMALPGFDPNEPFLTAVATRLPGSGATAFELDTSELSPCFEADDTSASPTLLINELDASTGALDQELVELRYRDAGALPLSGTVVVLFDGETDTAYAAFDLDGQSTDADGTFVLGNADVPGVDLVFDAGLLQDGPDAVALYQADATDFPAGAPITTDGLLDAVVYGSPPDDSELLALLAPDQPQVDEGSAGRASLHSLQRCADGSGNGRETLTFVTAPPTPDAENDCLRCLLVPSSSNLVADPMLVAFLRDGSGSPIADATVAFEVVEGPATGLAGASSTDADGRATFAYQRPAGACGPDTVEASGLVSDVPFVCRAQPCPWCPSDADLVLTLPPPPGGSLFQACSSIAALDGFEVAGGDEVTFRTRRVALGPGFRVLAGGSFVVELTQP